MFIERLGILIPTDRIQCRKLTAFSCFLQAAHPPFTLYDSLQSP